MKTHNFDISYMILGSGECVARNIDAESFEGACESIANYWKAKGKSAVDFAFICEKKGQMILNK